MSRAVGQTEPSCRAPRGNAIRPAPLSATKSARLLARRKNQRRNVRAPARLVLLASNVPSRRGVSSARRSPRTASERGSRETHPGGSVQTPVRKRTAASMPSMARRGALRPPHAERRGEDDVEDSGPPPRGARRARFARRVASRRSGAALGRRTSRAARRRSVFILGRVDANVHPRRPGAIPSPLQSRSGSTPSSCEGASDPRLRPRRPRRSLRRTRRRDLDASPVDVRVASVAATGVPRASAPARAALDEAGVPTDIRRTSSSTRNHPAHRDSPRRRTPGSRALRPAQATPALANSQNPRRVHRSPRRLGASAAPRRRSARTRRNRNALALGVASRRDSSRRPPSLLRAGQLPPRRARCARRWAGVRGETLALACRARTRRTRPSLRGRPCRLAQTPAPPRWRRRCGPPAPSPAGAPPRAASNHDRTQQTRETRLPLVDVVPRPRPSAPPLETPTALPAAECSGGNSSASGASPPRAIKISAQPRSRVDAAAPSRFLLEEIARRGPSGGASPRRRCDRSLRRRRAREGSVRVETSPRTRPSGGSRAAGAARGCRAGPRLETRTSRRGVADGASPGQVRTRGVRMRRWRWRRRAHAAWGGNPRARAPCARRPARRRSQEKGRMGRQEDARGRAIQRKPEERADQRVDVGRDDHRTTTVLGERARREEKPRAAVRGEDESGRGTNLRHERGHPRPLGRHHGDADSANAPAHRRTARQMWTTTSRAAARLLGFSKANAAVGRTIGRHRYAKCGGAEAIHPSNQNRVETRRRISTRRRRPRAPHSPSSRAVFHWIAYSLTLLVTKNAPHRRAVLAIPPRRVPDALLGKHLRQRRPRVRVRPAHHVALHARLRRVHRVRQHRRDGAADARSHDTGVELIFREVFVTLLQVLLGDGRQPVSRCEWPLAPRTTKSRAHEPRDAALGSDGATVSRGEFRPIFCC